MKNTKMMQFHLGLGRYSEFRNTDSLEEAGVRGWPRKNLRNTRK